jgi:hypothetical protein
VLSTRRATWGDNATLVGHAQQLLDKSYKKTCGLDAGASCREFGCAPRVWHVAFNSDIPAWSPAESARGIVATLDSWRASGAVVKDSYLHHGRYGVRWKSSDATITGNRISARYMEISPLEYYMEGPFRLTNITVTNNTFSECDAPVASFGNTNCTNQNLPLGHWCQGKQYGGGCGGVCKAAAVDATVLDTEACTDVSVEHNTP